jgi:hypothetical protein
VTEPSDAQKRARAAAAAMRAEGAYPPDTGGYQLEPERVTSTKLFEWAVIEPDLEDVRSTRRLGAPMTAFKRLLLRFLAQYHAELLAQQTRFNVNVVKQLRGLEQRLEAIERRAGDDEPPR